jgi:hypothetical protein
MRMTPPSPYDADTSPEDGEGMNLGSPHSYGEVSR